MRLLSRPLSEESSQLSAVSSQPERRSAFTILELVVVLMILSILGAAAIPSFFRSLEQQRLETAARRLKQDLELVRQTARNKSKTESLTFTGATTYTLSADVQGLDHKSQTYAVDLSAAPYNVSADQHGQLGRAGEGHVRRLRDDDRQRHGCHANGQLQAGPDDESQHRASGDYEQLIRRIQSRCSHVKSQVEPHTRCWSSFARWWPAPC